MTAARLIVAEAGCLLLVACFGRGGFYSFPEEACVTEPDSNLCAAAGYVCGSHPLVNRCNQTRQAWCGSCAVPGRCGGATTPYGSCEDQTFYPIGESDDGPASVVSAWGDRFQFGVVAWPTLGVSQGYPWIAWLRDGMPTDVYVRRFAQGVWEERHAGDASGGGVTSGSANAGYHSELVFDSAGNPAVAWVAPSSDSDLFVRRFDGTAWVELAGSGTGAGVSGGSSHAAQPTLLFDGSDRPVAVWRDGTTGIRARRFDGASWQNLGASTAVTAAVPVAPPLLARQDNGEPVMAWIESVAGANQVELLAFDGSVWQGLGGSATGKGVSASVLGVTSTALLVTGGSIFVAWTEPAESGGQAALVSVRRWDGSSWQAAAAGLDLTPTPEGTTLELPLLASWAGETLLGVSVCDAAYACTLDVRAWTGSAWAPTTYGWVPDRWPARPLALATDGTRLLLTHETDAHEPVVREWVSDAWRPLSSDTADGHLLGDPTRSAYLPVFERVAGTPTLAWVERDLDHDIVRLARFDGDRWQPVAGASVGLGETPGEVRSLRLQPTGELLVTWVALDAATVTQSYAARFADDRWDGLRGAADGAGLGGLASLHGSGHAVIDAGPDGRPVVVVGDDFQNLLAMRYEASGWQALGSGPAPSTEWIFPDPALVVDSQNRPVVAWTQGTVSDGLKLYLRRYENDSWVELAGSATGSGLSTTQSEPTFRGAILPRIAVDAQDHPVVAWTDATSFFHPHILVTRFDGSAWVDQGCNIQLLSGMLGRDGWTESLRVDADGRPVLAWTDITEPWDNIFVARYDGAAWEEVVPGSASGLGVSNSESTSGGASLWMGTNEVCATWVETGRQSMQVALRCAATP